MKKKRIASIGSGGEARRGEGEYEPNAGEGRTANQRSSRVEFTRPAAKREQRPLFAGRLAGSDARQPPFLGTRAQRVPRLGLLAHPT